MKIRTKKQLFAFFYKMILEHLELKFDWSVYTKAPLFCPSLYCILGFLFSIIVLTYFQCYCLFCVDLSKNILNIMELTVLSYKKKYELLCTENGFKWFPTNISYWSSEYNEHILITVQNKQEQLFPKIVGLKKINLLGLFH